MRCMVSTGFIRSARNGTHASGIMLAHAGNGRGGAGIAYGPIRLATRESRKDHLDKLIAAHAVSLGVTLVTNNMKDFAKYPGLHSENWLEPGGNQ